MGGGGKSALLLQNTITAKPLNQGSRNFYKISTSSNLSQVMCHLSCIMCHESPVTRHVSWVMCQVSHVIFKTPSQPNCLSWEAEILTEFPPRPTYRMSWVLCHVSQVTSHMWRVTYHMTSSKYFHSQTVSAREMKFWQKVHLPQPIRCHVSCVMCHVSWVMGHVSCVMCPVSCVMSHMSQVKCHR